MKTLSTLLMAILSLGLCAQDIPNSNFENWNFDNTWTWNPDDWETQNSSLIEHVKRDTAAFEGDYAMRVTWSEAAVGYWGEASSTIPLQAIPAQLSFYAKAFVEFAAVGVKITFFNEEIEVSSHEWYGVENIDEWTLVTIPLDQIEPILTHAVISVYFSAGDFVPADGWISVDQMGFDNSSTVPHEELTEQILYNSDTHLLSIRGARSGQLELYDAQGRTIRSVQVSEEIDLSALAHGQYIAVYRSDEQEVYTLSFMR